MIRNLKALGLMAFAALAMSAMFASTASAQEGFFTAGDTIGEKENPEHTDATVLGHQEGEPTDPEWNFFEAPEGSGTKVRCHQATFTGTLDEGGTGDTVGQTSTELTITPHYKECWTGENQPVTVDMNGCDYTFTQPTTEEGLEEGQYTGKADLTCPEGEVIEIGVYLFGTTTNENHSFRLCTIEVFPNGEEEGEPPHTTEELGGHLIYTGDTVEDKDDLTVEADIEEISFKDNCQSKEGDNGVYKQTVTVEAFNDDEEPHTERLDGWISD